MKKIELYDFTALRCPLVQSKKLGLEKIFSMVLHSTSVPQLQLLLGDTFSLPRIWLKFEAIFIALLFPWTFLFPRGLDPERLFVSGVSDLCPSIPYLCPQVPQLLPWVPYSFPRALYWAAGALRVPCSLPWIHDLLFSLFVSCIVYLYPEVHYFFPQKHLFIVSVFHVDFPEFFFPIPPSFFQGSEFLCIFPCISSAPLFPCLFR